LEGKRCPWSSETCQDEEAVTFELSTLDKFTVIYSNVDSLPNKKQELMSVINNARIPQGVRWGVGIWYTVYRCDLQTTENYGRIQEKP